jgi:hypothetical protein
MKGAKCIECLILTSDGKSYGPLNISKLKGSACGACAGDWGSGDDRRMLKALLQSGAAAEWEVDWGGLVPQRSAQHARRRWRLMLKCVPEHAEKDFDQILDFLVTTYTPDLKKGAAEEDGDEEAESGDDV